MNYKLLARILTEKNNPELSKRVFSRFEPTEVESIIPHLNDLEHLEQLISEFTSQEKLNCDEHKTLELIIRKIRELIQNNNGEPDKDKIIN